ncbi:hypothetical protein CN204_04245 [Sinorhizobium meliloti]|uniref:hypothetical protein n=1 Tax=Rhizobium meliloti TaxID=382 RepID=UPI000FDB3946|nr:hypothetical protein [Sinorhizobium meliloti]RVH87748.1 hypothetical protein CN204_04245 [Sinorhizobium meliloti]
MAIGTPVLATPAVGATATSVTTASFTPTAGDLLLAFATARPTAADIPTISDTLGNTWTQVGSSGTDFGNITAKLWYQIVESSPAARTVTASSTGSTQVGLAIVAISGAGTDFSNFQANTNAAGDPSVTMSAYAASSAALGFYAGNAGGSNVTIPTGYTSLTNSQIATNIRFAVVYDTSSPSTTQTWTGVSTDSICFGVEIKDATSGVSGSAAITEAGDTVSGSAAIALSSSAAITEAGDSATAAGALAITAGTAVTEAGDTLAATATGADEPQVTRRGDDAPVRTPAFVPEVPGLAEIEEVIQAEIKQPRAKTRKVKREVTRQIISLAGLFAEDIPPVVYRQVDKAISRIESNPDGHLLYAAIQLAIIKAIEDEEEDEMMMLLMVA